MTFFGALHVGVLLAGVAPGSQPSQPAPPDPGEQYRARSLYTAQRALNLVQDLIARSEALGGERNLERAAQAKQVEVELRRQIEFFGGKPAPEVGKLTFDDLQTSQELNEHIRTRTLNSFRRALASLRETIRKVEAMEDGDNKLDNLRVLRKQEAFYLQQVENLERGNLMPVMPVIPRKEVRRNID